jgi:predicted nucleotidyltransferase
MDKEKLVEIVRRVVRVAQPEKIILFGSGARESSSNPRDLDLLVITASGVHRGHMTEEIYMSMKGVGQAVDIVVVTLEDVERYRDNPYLVIYPALREGRVIYEREPIPSR